MARLPAARFSSASRSRSSCDVISRAPVELADDLEDRLVAFFWWRLRKKQPADCQMRLGAGLFRDQRVGSFLHSVMNKLVGTIETIDQLLAQSIPQSRVYLLLGLSQNERKHRDVGDVAEASKLPQRVQRFEG